MKTLKISLFLISLFSIILLNGQDSIPNPDFELWNTNTAPTGWHTVNEILPAGFVTCHQSSNSYSGDFAIQLKTIHMDSVPIPGVMALGTVGMGYTEGGIAFSAKPISFKGFFIHPTQGDEVMIIVQFYKNGNEIGTGFWSTSDSVSEFTEFNTPIYYQSTEMPDTLNITIVTDQNTIGSSLLIDALAFEYTSTSISKNNSQQIAIYPNPCNHHVSLDLPGDTQADIQIFDMSGRRVLHTSGRETRINTSTLKQGVYSLLIKVNNEIYQEKLIKQ